MAKISRTTIKVATFIVVIRIIKHLFPLFIIQFFTWLALFALWIYAVPVITRYFFNSTDAESAAFENGVFWVGMCFAFYATLAAFLAFTIPKLLKYISKEKLHAISLLMGGVGLTLIVFINNKYLLPVAFTFIGIAWSSISTIPYKIISDIAPDDKMANYFTVFNFSVVIPQVTAAFLLGYLNKYFFAGETRYVILTGGCSMLLAGVLMMFIKSKSALD